MLLVKQQGGRYGAGYSIGGGSGTGFYYQNAVDFESGKTFRYKFVHFAFNTAIKNA
jgi:hypothetical protein